MMEAVTTSEGGSQKEEVVTLSPRQSPDIFSLLCAGLALLVASCSNIWIVNAGRFTDGYMVSGPRHCTLWRILLKRLPADFEEAPRSGRGASSVLQEHRGTFVTALAIFAFGGAVGRALYWLLWERGAVQQDEP
jgi:hypothetical protein